jgi:hypothetical protein
MDDRNVSRTGRPADGQIGLEFDRELDEFVVRFAGAASVIEYPGPAEGRIMGATLIPVANNAGM